MKKIYTLLSLALCLVLVTGCSLSKVSMTSDEFKETMVEKNFEIQDDTDQFIDFYDIKSVTIAISPDNKYQIEFYEFDSDATAISLFDKNKEIFEEKTNNSMNSSVDGSNYSTFSISNVSDYRYLCRINNTMIYVDTDVANKDDIKKVVADIGY